MIDPAKLEAIVDAVGEALGVDTGTVSEATMEAAVNAAMKAVAPVCEEAVTELKGRVKHEFNNQLTVLVCGVDELRKPMYDQDRDDVLDDMKHAAEHLRLKVIELAGYPLKGGQRG